MGLKEAIKPTPVSSPAVLHAFLAGQGTVTYGGGASAAAAAVAASAGAGAAALAAQTFSVLEGAMFALPKLGLDALGAALLWVCLWGVLSVCVFLL